MKEDPGLGVYIAGCTEIYVTSIEECFDVMRQGGENRAVAATGMNEGSSRSHSLFIVFLSQKDSKSGTVKTGRFFLVDLAGTSALARASVHGWPRFHVSFGCDKSGYVVIGHIQVLRRSTRPVSQGNSWKRRRRSTRCTPRLYPLSP